MENINNCPICNSSNFALFLQCEDYTVSHKLFNIVECESCSFRFTNPRPSQEEIAPYYKSEEYISHTNTSKGLINSIYQIVRKYTLVQKLKLISSYSNGRSILDYGSGAGFFLNYCKEKDWKTKGVEADNETRENSVSNFNLDVISPAQLSTLNNDKFDVITLWHVLEHIHDLKPTLQALINSLNNDGVLFIAVPNCESYDANHYKNYWAAYDLPRHLYHFRPKNIKKLFSQFNMDIVKILPMKFDSFYVSMLSEKYKFGGSGIIKGFLNGLVSNIKGDRNSSFSSQIYVIKKNKAI